MADIAAIALLQERVVHESRDVVQHLKDALNSRVVIEQAKGVVVERARIGVDAAFARLRAHARDHDRRLSDVARELIDRRLDATLAAKTAPGAACFER
jgi:AmiR/NasT family two-component response regulator